MQQRPFRAAPSVSDTPPSSRSLGTSVKVLVKARQLAGLSVMTTVGEQRKSDGGIASKSIVAFNCNLISFLASMDFCRDQEREFCFQKL